MFGLQDLRWLILGFAAATLAAAVADSRPAAAQTAAAQGRSPDLTVPDAASRSSRAPAPEPDGEDTTDSAVPAGDPSADPEETDPDNFDRPRSGQRPVVVDGDLTIPSEAAAPIDGVTEPTEPEAPLDGADPTTIDMRDKEESDLFESVENPPAGYDPLLFQIEELEPILDRRPERLFKFEPYDPIGIKAGSFIYYPEADINGAWFSNVFSSPLPENDVALELKSKSRLVSNWKVHAVELSAASNWSFYNEFDSENDKEYSLEARGRLDITKRTDLQGSIAHERTQESRGAIDAATAGSRPNVDTDRGNLALTHAFNRLEVQLRASVADQDIGDTEDGFGGIVSNDDRDTKVKEEFLRLTYELKPSFAVFAEGGLNQRDYKLAAFSDGLRRDGDGQRYRVGLDFGDEGKVLRGELSLGYGLQDPDAAELEEVDGFLFDANVTWRVTDLTALRLTGRTDIFDTTTAGSGGVLAHQIGLEARHAFRHYLIGTAGVSYSTNEFSGVDINEDEVRFNLDAEYFASREIILFGKYQHTAFQSSEPDADWDSDEIRVGVRLRR